MAMESQTTTVTYNAQTVGEIISIGGPSGSAPVINISHLGSTSAAKLMGIMDEGQVVLECNFDPTDVGQNECKDQRAARTSASLVITLSDANTITVTAFCTGFAVSNALNTQAKLTITLECTGAAAITEV